MDRKEVSQYDEHFENELGNKLAFIEEIRYLLDRQGIECPGVLVIGAQSSGKSSVLERLTGISFPRGENTCTRFPTIVQLQTDSRVEENRAFVSTCPEFSDAVECCSMRELQVAILRYTEELKSDDLPINDTPIHVRYVRHSGPVMTLIDLPGITHVDAKDESFDIHAMTAGMVEKYVNNQNMVVLVVIPANDDFGNSEALRIARMYDAKGDRTVGVVSKCDLVPHSSDIVEKIRMSRESDVKLSLGFVAVRNKGPDEEDVNISSLEKELFATHKVLRRLKKDEWGYTTLSRKIVQLQSSRVNRFIPQLRSAFRSKILEAEKKFKELGIVPATAAEMRHLLTTALATLEGTLLPLIRSETTNFDVNIASKTFEFAEKFATRVKQKVPDFFHMDYHSKILEKMKKSTGYSLPNFIGDAIFRNEISDIFFKENIPDSAQVFIDKIAELMEDVLHTVIGEITLLQSYPSLGSLIMEECRSLLYTAKERATSTVTCVIDSEAIQVFTMNDDYLKSILNTRELLSHRQMQSVAQKQLNHLQSHHHVSQNDYNGPLIVYDDSSPKKIQTAVTDEFIEKYVEAKGEGILELAAFDLQMSIQQYSEILMKRDFDIIPIIVRSILVIDVVTLIHVKVQQNIEDESLMILVSEHAAVLREKQSIAKDLENLREAQEKLKALK